MKPKILITNDDGIHAPGIRFLYEALKEMADLVIVAPSEERSASSLSITIRHPLTVRPVKWENNVDAWSVSGTPSDCIKLALSQYLISPPDLVVAGINPGSNAGRNLLYSGTVAGVIEGLMHDVPGIAFSTESYYDPDFATWTPYIPRIVNYILQNPLNQGTLLNVNFPSTKTPQGIKLTRQGSGMWMENPEKRVHPTEGHHYYWIGQKELKNDEPEDTDTYWLSKKYITCVPAHVAELTDHEQLQQRKNAFESYFDLVN